MTKAEREIRRGELLRRVGAIIDRRGAAVAEACRQVARSERRAGRQVSWRSMVRWWLAVQADWPGVVGDHRREPVDVTGVARRCVRLGLGVAYALLCRELPGRTRLAPALLAGALRSAGLGRRTLEMAKAEVMGCDLSVAAECERAAAGLVGMAGRIRERRAAITAMEALSVAIARRGEAVRSQVTPVQDDRQKGMSACGAMKGFTDDERCGICGAGGGGVAPAVP
ncbi:MAG TPA: hypothetical protein PLC79_03710 [Phycisphaerae bacterium]|nr:hypothetical protein [Phycisphaerae bacterium]